MKKHKTKHKTKKKIPQERQSSKKSNSMPVLHPNSAGIDIGSKSHFVAVPEDRDTQNIREFCGFTSGLYAIASWLKECRIETIVMESTGAYWIPLFEVLDQEGFDVKLVNARHVKNVSAHKTDVEDCQWLQQLASFGLLKGAFRPENDIVELRAYLRQRDMLIKNASQHIQHMQKALIQMNVQLHNVISDITGVTGMAIIRNILRGERDPKILASLRDGRCHNSEEVILESLKGNYRDEHVFALKQAVELYDFYNQKIVACNDQIAERLKRFEGKIDKKKARELAKDQPSNNSGKHQFPISMKEELIRITGVDLTKIPGIDVSSALTILSEIGTDMSRWKTAKHFASWLGLSPGNKISGGKRLSGKTKPCANRVSSLLRVCANTLYRADCAFGAFLRRMKMRLGSPKAITALAHKLSKLIYVMLKYGEEYVEKGKEFYEELYRQRQEKNLRRNAARLGYELIPKQQSA